MSDVVVHVAVGDTQAETKFTAALEAFSKLRLAGTDPLLAEAPDIMVKTIESGDIVRKALIFQDRHAAAEFLSLWRREKRSG